MSFVNKKFSKYIISLFVIIILFVFGEVCRKRFFYKTDKITYMDRDGIKRAPNLLLFNCHYGAGHKMATQGIQESLPDCNIRVVDIYADPLKSLDWMGEISPKLSNEYLYNKMIKNENYSFLNLAGKLCPKFFFLQKNRVEKLLMDYIVRENPDMIISCIPLVNPMLLNVAQKLEIPLLVVTTDIDISAFCYGFTGEHVSHDKNLFRMTVPFSEETWDPLFRNLVPEEIKSSLQYCFGYPTRHAFSETIKTSRITQLRNEYQIAQDENVILVMMGGNAGKAAENYARLLLNMEEDKIIQIVGKENPRNKIRMICLCGDISQEENHDFMLKLNAMNYLETKKNNLVHIHACPGTSQIAELVSLPELHTVISKPGGSTVNEMIKKKVPMIYHTSKVPLDWERGNMEYGISQNLGRSFCIEGNKRVNLEEELAVSLSSTFIKHRAIQKGEEDIPESKFDFSNNLRSAVKEMIFVRSNKMKANLQEKAVFIPSDRLENWYKVDDLVYRSAQPGESGVEEARKFGIKRVINLRKFHNDVSVASCADLQFFQVSMNPGKIKDCEVIEALRIIKSSNEPILVHCWHGADRTGVVIAMYRILFHGWDKEQAIREMCNEDFGYHDIYKNIVRYIREVDVEKMRQDLYQSGEIP